MIYLFLLLAIAPPTRAEILDCHFAIIQEEWIYQQARPVNLDHVLPGDLADLVRDLGCGRFTCRRNAEKILTTEHSDRAMRALIWGSHCRDAEIANRCELMLRAYRTCDHCCGTTRCPDDRPRWDHPCDVCEAVYQTSDWDECLYRMLLDHECLYCYGNGYLDGRWFR